MADEIADNQPEQPQEVKPKKSKKKLLIIIASALVALSLSGFLAYTMLGGNKKNTDGADHQKGEKAAQTVLVPLDPFVLNLAEPGRFLKLTIHFELSDPLNQQMVTDHIPQLKDAIIILISSKSIESLSSPEGKLQLKDELLLRANLTIGKDIFKNLYFTEFVMQ